MVDRDLFVTPSGSTAYVKFIRSDSHPARDVERHFFNLSLPGGGAEGLNVSLVSPPLINAALQQNGQPPLAQVKDELVRLAAVSNYDRVSALPPDESGNRLLEIDGVDALAILNRPRLSDRYVRRFIMRRVYQDYSRDTLLTRVTMDGFDARLLGASPVDMLRNAQVLEAEGYLSINRASGDLLTLVPTAKLVREVERYGAAKEDVVTERDYLGALQVYPSLQPYLPTLELEYRRYAIAQSDTELNSIFKAIAPVVEAVLKDLLKAQGSRHQHSTLGPAIADLQSRDIGDQSLWSQLNHVLKFGRDLAQHGAVIPPAVLRIACENAFELVPQLAALFPR